MAQGQNGTEVKQEVELTTLPPVVGINFGNSYASIAVFTKEGLAECIANEDGERQIACAIAFRGEQIYIGNQAKPQIVKNAENTITGFRNLLGKKFSELPQSILSLSAPVIQHPDQPDVAAYKVQVLSPSPSPLPPTTTSSYNTPSASTVATPRSEPILTTRILTVSEVTTMFLSSLVTSAEAFLGKKVKDMVITVPSWFSKSQKDALEKAAKDTGVNVLQLLEESGAVVATTTSDTWVLDSLLLKDRTQLIVDVGASSTTATLLSLRSGLAYTLATKTTENVGGDQIDDKLVKFFASEFTKKTKIQLSVVPSIDIQDKRAEAKLRLALEHTKRTISASSGAATCSVESLKDGIDYTGAINRMRFDLIERPIYVLISNLVIDLLKEAGIDSNEVDEIVYVGGSGCLPGLDEHLVLSGGFREGVETPFERGIVTGGGIGDPTTILARGCALQAYLISNIQDEELKEAFLDEKKGDVEALTRTIGVLVPGGGEEELGGTWVSVIQKETALPVRRTVRFDIQLPKSNKIALEVWEVSEGIRIEKIQPPKPEYSDGEVEDEEEEEEEEIEVKHKTIKKENYLGLVRLDAKLGVKAKGDKNDTTTVDVQFTVHVNGGLNVVVKEYPKDGAEGSLIVAGSD